MGRSKKRKGWRNFNNSNKKKRRGHHERFWIEDCEENAPESDSSPLMEVLITRVELEDDYHQIPRPIDTSKTTEKEDAIEFSEMETLKKDIPSTVNHSEVLVAPPKVDLPSPHICIKRSSSAKGKLRKTFYRVDNFKPLPNGDCGDGILNPHPKELVPDKFWSQRRRLFTRFDEGIQLDKESWYSVTPEAIANHISASMVSNHEKIIILDMFCGCGGNAIGFAARQEVQSVICVDNDIEKLKRASHNAKIYGIAKEKMTFIHASACQVLNCYSKGKLTRLNSSQKDDSGDDSEKYSFGGLEQLPSYIDMLFVSPPWGGQSYVKVGRRNYDLACIQIQEDHGIVNGEVLLHQIAEAFGHIPTTLFLPKNINGIALGKSVYNAGYSDCPLVLEQNILNGKLKTVTAYLGKN